MLRIHTTQQLSFVITQRDGVISLTRPGLPRRLLPSQHSCQAIKVCHYTSIHGFVEREQPSLKGKQLAYRYSFFTLLGELRPVFADRLFVVEPASRMRDGNCHGSQPVGSGVY